MDATGMHTARAAEAAALVTRLPKVPELMSGPGLRQRWLAQAAELGLEPAGPEPRRARLSNWCRALDASERAEISDLHGSPRRARGAHGVELDVRAARRGASGGRGPGSWCQRRRHRGHRRARPPHSRGRHAPGRRAGRRAAPHHPRALGVGTLAARDGRPAPPRSARGGRRRRTRRMRSRHFSLLSGEQVAMVERLATSGAGVDVVVGKAGAGKTLGLAAARLAWEGSGARVLGTALSARAARGLSEGAGISSDTLARVLARVDSRIAAPRALRRDRRGRGGHGGDQSPGRLRRRDRMPPGPSWCSSAIPASCPRSRPVARWPPWSSESAPSSSPRTGANASPGNAWPSTPCASGGPMSRSPPTSGPVGSTARQVWTEARLELVERWAESYRRRPRRRHAGRRACRSEAPQRRRPRRRCRRRADLGADILVVDDLGFAVGDKVVCLRNDRRIGVVNGTDRHGRARRRPGPGHRDGRRPTRAAQAYLEAGHLGHAYALTIHKAQGLTVERAYVLAGESLSQESGYVAMSRAREMTELFVPLAVLSDERAHDLRQFEVPDPLADLRRRLGNSRAKRLATDELDGEGQLRRRCRSARSGVD